MDLQEACQSQAELKREVTRVLEAVIAFTPADWVLLTAFVGAVLTGVGGIVSVVSTALALALAFIA
ncbi:MAG: hypothetical protein ACXVI5_06010 [Halobacteriota archaeon]